MAISLGDHLTAIITLFSVVNKGSDVLILQDMQERHRNLGDKATAGRKIYIV
jgi:hypothetical protein